MNHATDLGSPAWREIASRSLDEVRGYILAPYREGEPFAPDSFDGVFRDASKVDSILDFGCGVGRNAEVLRERCDDLTLYDIPEMVSHYRSLGNDARTRVTSDWSEVISRTYDLTVAGFRFPAHRVHRCLCLLHRITLADYRLSACPRAPLARW